VNSATEVPILYTQETRGVEVKDGGIRLVVKAIRELCDRSSDSVHTDDEGGRS